METLSESSADVCLAAQRVPATKPGKKLTQEQAENRYSDMVRGQTWKGVDEKYLFRCEAGHPDYKQAFCVHKMCGCPKCGRLKTEESRRFSIEQAEARHSDMVRGQVWENAQTKYEFRCTAGLHPNYTQIYDDHNRGKGCQKCGYLSRSKLLSLDIKEAESQFSELLRGQTWHGVHTQYTFHCFAELGHPNYEQEYNNHQRGSNCPLCGLLRKAESRRLNIKDVELRALDMVPGQIWKGAKEKYFFLCPEHGEYKQAFTNHDQGKSCQKCARLKIKEARSLSIEEAESRCPDMVPGQTWKGSNEKYLFRCPAGCPDYIQIFTGHTKGCQRCGRLKTEESRRLTIEQAESRYPDMIRGQIWKGIYEKYIFICHKHGKYEQRFSSHKTDGCLACPRSNGEHIITRFLNRLGMPYEHQKRFDSCRHKAPLAFDFFLPFQRTLIEFQGAQHYRPVDFTGHMGIARAKANFESAQVRDDIKRRWCLENNYKLIEVCFSDLDPEGFLLSQLQSDLKFKTFSSLAKAV